jgi:beta-glucosidase
MNIPFKKMAGLCAFGLVSLLGCAPTERATDNQASTAVANPAIWPKVTSAVAQDPAVEQKIDALIAKMTLEQKVGQLIQPELRHVTPESIKKYHIGSLLNGGGSFPGENKYATPADWIALADSFYHAAMDDSDGSVAIPILWGTDAVHGHNNVIGATIFPHNIALGATRNPDLIRQIGAATAREVSVTGINWNFAPTLAVARDDRWGRTYEAYAEDPAVVKTYGGAYVEGLQGRANTTEFFAHDKVIGTAKHFIADGGTETGVDRGDAQMSEQELFAIHGAGYLTAIGSGVQTVMASFNSWQGEKLHGHKYLLTDVLKNQMGFDGLVVGDWNGHEFVSGCSRLSCAQAINAGVDIFMAPDADWSKLFDNTLAQVNSGEITQARLDDAVRRILRVKIRAGLFDKGAPSSLDFAGKEEWIGAAEHRAIARQAVRESLVLLKNNNKLLPLERKLNVLVAGDGADNIGKQSGGWTISWQGTGNTNSDFPGGSSVYQGIAEVVNAAGGKAELNESGSYNQKPDVAIVVFGENPYAEMQGDVSDLTYRSATDLALLKKLKTDGIPVVSLFISGRPLWVNAELNASDAFAAIWLPGSEGAGVADVIFKDAVGQINHDFKGKLSFSWPASPTQSPLNLDQDDYQPLFAFGYGLTYQDDVSLELLPEEKLANATDSHRLDIFNNRPLDPWKMTLSDHLNNTVTMTGSSANLANISVNALDRFVQEDSLRIRWNGQGMGRAGFFAQTRTDLTDYAAQQGALVFDVKINAAASADLRVGVYCGQDCGEEISIKPLLQTAPVGEWTSMSVALECFAQGRARLDMVLAPFYLANEGALDLSLYNLRVEKNTAADIACQ